jgi:hypothetical protein
LSRFSGDGPSVAAFSGNAMAADSGPLSAPPAERTF